MSNKRIIKTDIGPEATKEQLEHIKEVIERVSTKEETERKLKEMNDKKDTIFNTDAKEDSIVNDKKEVYGFVLDLNFGLDSAFERIINECKCKGAKFIFCGKLFVELFLDYKTKFDNSYIAVINKYGFNTKSDLKYNEIELVDEYFKVLSKGHIINYDKYLIDKKDKRLEVLDIILKHLDHGKTLENNRCITIDNNSPYLDTFNVTGVEYNKICEEIRDYLNNCELEDKPEVEYKLDDIEEDEDIEEALGEEKEISNDDLINVSKYNRIRTVLKGNPIQFIDDLIELINLVDTDLPLSNFDCAIRMDTLPDICIIMIIEKLNDIREIVSEGEE